MEQEEELPKRVSEKGLKIILEAYKKFMEMFEIYQVKYDMTIEEYITKIYEEENLPNIGEKYIKFLKEKSDNK